MVLRIHFNIWLAVGWWLACCRKSQKTIKKFFWATVVQVVIILGSLQIIFTHVSNATIIIKTIKLSVGLHEFSDSKIDVINGRTVEIIGYLPFQIIKVYDKLQKVNPEIKTVKINIPGGITNPEKHIIESILARKMDTYSSKLSVSICIDIFLSGDIRTVEPGIRFGFQNTDLVIKDDDFLGRLYLTKELNII